MTAGKTLSRAIGEVGLLAWLPAAVVAAILAVSVVTDLPARLPFSLCFFRNVTGIPCPGCGMTRGFIAMGHGRLAEAWQANPLAPVLFAGACGYVAWFVLRRLLRGGNQPAVRRPPWSARRRKCFAGLMLVVLFGAVGVSWTISLERHFASPRPRPNSVFLRLTQPAAATDRQGVPK